MHLSQDAQQQLQSALDHAWHNSPSPTLQRITCSQVRSDASSPQVQQLQKIIARPISIKGQWLISAVWRYSTQDITKNYSWNEFLVQLEQWMQWIKQVNVLTLTHDIQLKYKKKQWYFQQNRLKQTSDLLPISTHNRVRSRYVDQQQLFLQQLGITDQHAQIIPSMARKWKQINKFVEIFAHALQEAHLTHSPGSTLHVADFGAGKGYLTFAIYDYLKQQGIDPQVTGIELRSNLVQLCQQIAQRIDFQNLNFFEGDVRSYQPAQTDVMIALHACDTATDYAIFSGIRLGARIIMCSPCCHKELRPQLFAPPLLQPLLIHGIQANQYAEMLTDSIRALLLSAYGYQCKIIEFISLEHTSKNKMILAIKQGTPTQSATPGIANRVVLDQVEQLLQQHHITSQTLFQLLSSESNIASKPVGLSDK